MSYASRIAAVLLIAVTGCASIVHGRSQDLGISSSPTGAQVMVDGNNVGITPVVAKLSRGDNHIVKIQMAGYAPFETTLTKSVSGWVWGNVLFGGLIGLAVDAMTGGLYYLSPEQLTATLALPAPKVATSGGIFVAVVLKPDPSWQRIGQLEQAQ